MLNPMRLKDYITVGNILGGFASMIAVIEGNLDWACIFMIIAWLFDSFDGVAARMTGGGNKFGEVFDNVADLVAYSLAPSMIIYLVYRTPTQLQGAGWPIWAAAMLASVPTVVGCIRFARNNVKDIILPEFHLGLPRTVYALFIATMFSSHVFQGIWNYAAPNSNHPALFVIAAVLVLATSWLVLTLQPYWAKPKKGANRLVVFSTAWFLTTSLGALIVGLVIGTPRIFFDTLLVNFLIYICFQPISIPLQKKLEVKEYMKRIIAEWKRDMG